jgi:predicted HicB family RNase H-like nuclease
MTKANYDLLDDFVKGAEDRASEHKTKTSDTLVMLNTRVPKELRDRVKMAALKNDTSITAIIGEAIETWLTENEFGKSSNNAFADDGL